jgi:hypothetical protein
MFRAGIGISSGNRLPQEILRYIKRQIITTLPETGRV